MNASTTTADAATTTINAHVPLLSVTQVAAIGDCTPDTVREHATAGRLPGLKLGRDWVFPAAALYQALCELAAEEAARRKKPSKPPAVRQPTPDRRRPPALP